MRLNTMQNARIWLAAALLAAAGGAIAGVTVEYTDPEKFIDLPRSPHERDRVLKEVRDHFAKLGKDLPAGQDLKVTISDIDLAGWAEPRRWSTDDVRIMRGGADWPRIDLTYSLEENGQVLRSGKDSLKNMMYQQRLNKYTSSDAMRYEKQMIDDWFRTAITGAQVSQR
jgi:hypothetical protein